MKVVCGYDPGEYHRVRFAGWMDEWAQVVVSPEEDVAKFASEIRERPPRRGGPAAHPEARHGGGPGGCAAPKSRPEPSFSTARKRSWGPLVNRSR